MLRRDKIKKLYFDYNYKQIEIAEELNVSTKYISKILRSDSRYNEEKHKRKEENKKNNIEFTKRYMTAKRKENKDTDYLILKSMHEQASRELSGGRKPISNRVFRNWNASIYRYNEKNKSYVLRKGIKVGADVPTKISWKNF